jgi:hypothetical protein
VDKRALKRGEKRSDAAMTPNRVLNKHKAWASRDRAALLFSFPDSGRVARRQWNKRGWVWGSGSARRPISGARIGTGVVPIQHTL